MDAINNRTRLVFEYQSQGDTYATLRVVEPYTYGTHINGTRMLVGREITKDGATVGEVRSFHEDKITDLKVVLTESFDEPGVPPHEELWEQIDATV